MINLYEIYAVEGLRVSLKVRLIILLSLQWMFSPQQFSEEVWLPQYIELLK